MKTSLKELIYDQQTLKRSLTVTQQLNIHDTVVIMDSDLDSKTIKCHNLHPYRLSAKGC